MIITGNPKENFFLFLNCAGNAMMDELNSLEKKPRLDLKDNMEIMSSKVLNSIICLCMRSFNFMR